jgi:hypothetical protein
MKMNVRIWVAVCALGSLVGVGCGVAQEEPKEIVAPVVAPAIPPAATSSPAAANAAAGKSPSVKASTIVIIETEPPPGLVAPSAPVVCWTSGDDGGLLCALADGQCCHYEADHTLVGCGTCDRR